MPTTILLVDDIPTNLEVLSTLLKPQGYRIAIAIDGQTALSVVENLPVDLVLLDVMMPGIDGFETCRQLKHNPKTQDIPIIFTTAMTESEHKVKAFSLGAVDYITKPFHTTEVLARVQTHLKIRQLNQQLTQQVGELHQTLAHLKQTQAQLVQKEKMSGLGHLVAGIAHEINNPINFIYGNARHVNTYADSLMTMLRLYEQHYPSPPLEITETAEDLDIEFIFQDLPKLTGSMQDGAHRIHQMVLSLRNFSRLDEADLKYVDMAEGIDSTLLLLKRRLGGNSYRAAIDVVREFDTVPSVECYPSKLNQALMNLLNNAIDALDFGRPQQPHIHLRLSQPSSHSVQIEIADNGPGIPHDIQDKIFDPFFTTKPVGQGTGLGLSISYQIIADEHGGTLTYQPIPTGGAEFTLEIPTQQRRITPPGPTAVPASV